MLPQPTTSTRSLLFAMLKYWWANYRFYGIFTNQSYTTAYTIAGVFVKKFHYFRDVDNHSYQYNTLMNRRDALKCAGAAAALSMTGTIAKAEAPVKASEKFK